MNIGIITFHRAENYGSALQAYALNTFLRTKYSNDIVETIDYQNIEQYRIYRLFQPIYSIMDVVRFVHTLLYVRSLRLRKSRFHKFINESLSLSTYHGNDIDELRKYSQKYSVVICGSDQIWNVRCQDYDACYMLSFVNGALKVAYAPSLGLSAFLKNEENVFKHFLGSFDALSVRETEGALYLSRILHKKVEVVADPVFLLSAEHWRQLEVVPQIKGKYILCYFIGEVSGMRAFAKRVQRETGIKQVIVIIKNLRDIFSGYIPKFDTGPKEFIGLIDGAEYIITDSFHAVAFSLLLHKKFWVFVEIGTKASLKPNSRIINILDKTDLMHRMLNDQKSQECLISEPIDFQHVDSVIGQYASHSQNFINDSLKQVK